MTTCIGKYKFMGYVTFFTKNHETGWITPCKDVADVMKLDNKVSYIWFGSILNSKDELIDSLRRSGKNKITLYFVGNITTSKDSGGNKCIAIKELYDYKVMPYE